MQIKKREKQNNRYAPSLKRKIAKEYLAGRASYAILAEENGLRDKSVVREFVKWYRQKLQSDPDYETKIESLEKSKKTGEILYDDVLLEMKRLKKQLRQTELQVEMLETIIDIAESRFEIEIRKKSGTKQSNK